MILFLILAIIAAILLAIVIVTVSVIGVGGIIIFGDVIVCIAIIVWILWKIIKKH